MNEAVDLLMAQVADALPRWGRRDRIVPGSVAGSRRGWSFQVRFVLDGGAVMIAKVPRWEGVDSLGDAMARGAQQSTRREFEVLETIAAAVARQGDIGLAAVRPVGYLEDANAIVTEELVAVPLRAIAAREPGRLVGVLEALGRLLRLLHDSRGAARAPYPGADYIRELEGLDSRISEISGPPRGWKGLIEPLRQASRRLDGRPCRVAEIHGDLTPANVLVTGDGRVAVLDPSPRRAAVEEDPAKLLVELATGRDRVLRQVFGRGDAALARWETALFTGYGAGASEAWPAARGLALARRWASVEERRAGDRGLTPAGIGLPLVRRSIRRAAMRLVGAGGL